jgi:diguanylate cyclase (GGDEF)-like protein
MSVPSPSVTESDWRDAQRRVIRLKWVTMAVAAVVMPAMSIPALALTTALVSGGIRYAVVAGWAFVLLLPLVYLVLRISVHQQLKTDQLVAGLTGQLSDALASAAGQAARQHAQAARQQFERRLANALEMAEGEPEVIDVIERSFRMTLPGSPVELLLADNSHAHLLRVAAAGQEAGIAGCAVDSPDQCPAARRAQVQRFTDSDALDACPKLRGRGPAPISAMCVPVSIMGRTVGIIHVTGAAGAPFDEDAAHEFATVANLAGARIGLLRVMAETELQAATDNLTGLLNRRTFEQKLSPARARAGDCAVAIADLDHFKLLNDTYGHETGDRALRLFAQVLTESVRAGDLLCRHGGEEFAVALLGCGPAGAAQVFDAFRARLDAAVTVAGLPRFTVSVGVVGAGAGEDLPALLARADAALFEAKRNGRNQVVVHAAAACPAQPRSRDSLGLGGAGLAAAALERADQHGPAAS